MVLFCSVDNLDGTFDKFGIEQYISTLREDKVVSMGEEVKSRGGIWNPFDKAFFIEVFVEGVD